MTEVQRQAQILRLLGESIDDLAFWSFRYFVGRRTIHTCCFARSLASAWPFLEAHVRDMIRRELDREFECDDRARQDPKHNPAHGYPLGEACDRQAWQLVKTAYEKENQHGLRPHR